MNETIKLLIVDDEPMARHRIRSFNLSPHGFEIVGEAENGQDALELVDCLHPDIVVTDIVMPLMDGLKLLENINLRKNPPRVILLTCYEEFSLAQTAVRLGAEDYIVKLFLKEEDFIQVIEKAARKILEDRKIRSRAILKLLSSMLSYGYLQDFKEIIEQLGELGFNPDQYAFVSLKADARLLKQVQVEKLTMPNHQMLYGIVPALLTRNTWMVYIYNTKPCKKSDFLDFTRQYAKNLFQQFQLLDSRKDNNFWVVAGSVFSHIGDLPKASEDMFSLLKNTYYMDKGSIIYADEMHVPRFGEIPRDELYNIVNRFREACMEGDGVQAGKCLHEWLLMVEMYKASPDDIKSMVSLISMCIPVDIQVFDENGNLQLLGQHLKDNINGALHILDLRNIVLMAIQSMEIGFDAKYACMRKEIKEAISYIRRYYNQDISLTMAAKHVNLSPSWFGALFFKETKQSFWDYLTAYRMKMAQHLLVNTDMQVSQIAEKVGIHSFNYFSRLFSKIVGQSPSEYRSTKKK